MHTPLQFAQGPVATGAPMTIGQLALATGVPVGTLRMWETRHGFPRAERTTSGHRRYSEADVEAVRRVLALRDSGVRLDAAISRSVAPPDPPPAGSAYAEVLRRHPEQPREQLRKRTLVALSRAMEDEIAASAEPGHLFGAFQRLTNFNRVRSRWGDLARSTASAYALVDSAERPAVNRVELVALAEESPMRREWSVVFDARRLPLALVAWELPGQRGVPDSERLFESIWTLDAAAVRTAARACAQVAQQAGSPTAGALLTGPLLPPVFGSGDPLALSRLAHRVVAYVETSAS